MIFLFISIVVPLFIYFFLPLVLGVLFKKPAVSTWPLLAGGLIFFFSWYIPSPLIQGENTQFLTHFFGGGLFCGFVWLYLKNYFKLQLSLLLEAVSLYALVSSLGVANELFELLVVKTGLVRLSAMDTWWDLLANTLGALVFWILYKIFARAKI
jgi:hypothetical protein